MAGSGSCNSPHSEDALEGHEDCPACRRAANIVAIDAAEYEEFVTLLDLYEVPRDRNVKQLTLLIAGRGN